MKKKIKVLYIVGAGNSGSTLLSMVLGAHKKAISVGELNHIGRYAQSPDMLCSCSQPFSECAFWSKIHKPDLGHLLPKFGYLNTLKRNWKALKLNNNDKATIKVNEYLYTEISNISKSQIIIDSSKDMRRLCYLTRSEIIEVIPLYLVRDVRAYMDSYTHRKQGPSLFGAFRWLRLNMQTILGLQVLGLMKACIKVNFQDFTNTPEKHLKDICKILGIEYSDEMLEYHLKTNHNLAGTNSATRLKPIASDQKWRDRMTFSQKLIYFVSGIWIFNHLIKAQ